MERKFNGINFDLANNLVHCEENKIDTLKRYSLMLLSVTIFKRSRTIKAICPKNGLKKMRPHFLNITEWEYIEMSVERELLMYLETKSFNIKVLQPHVKELNHFVSMQIYDFIYKAIISEFNHLIYFLKNLYFTNQGTINLRNTVRRILEVPSILRYPFLRNTKAKFALACNYFLEEDIKMLSEDLSRTNTLFNNLICGSLFEEFWIHIIDNPLNYLKEISSDTTLKLFQTAVENNNEVAVHYFWSLFIKGESEKNMVLEKLVPMTIFPERINICMFFLFQVNESEFKKYFKSSLLTVIQILVEHIRWHCHLFRILKMLKSEIDINFLETLVDILMESYFSSYSVGINFEAIVHCYISLLECVQRDALLEVKFLYENIEKILLNTFIHEKENLAKLSKFYGRIEMKNFFISGHGINFISEAIKIGNLETLGEFLFSLFPQNNFEEIQKNFFDLNAYAVSLYFVESLRFQELHLFISKWSVCKEVCQRFKRQILYMNRGFCIKRILFNMDTYSIDESFSIANEVLTWCCEDNLNILAFKRTLILDADKIDEETENFRIPFYNEVRNCVMQSKWEFLGLLFQWKESTSNEKRALRLRLLNDNLIIPVMPMMDERLEFLYQFIQFLKTHLHSEHSKDDNDINKFQEYVFNVNKFHKLITKEKLFTIKSYIKWLEPLWEKLQKFKWRAELLVGNNHEIVNWLESLQNDMMLKKQR